MAPDYFSPEDYAIVEAACERLIPAGDGFPGAREAGAAAYIDALLGAFLVEPPRIWAGGPFSGRAGGEGSFERFTPPARLEELAWRTRIEGSRGIPEREWNGPVRGWQEIYAEGLAALGTDFAALPREEQDARLDALPAFKSLIYEHACEGTYGAPEYGGNRGAVAWRAVGWNGDVQPRGYTDDEVRSP